jgi:hypothetical protein
MKYSPKLKRIMAEIKEILDREDVAGYVVIHTPDSGHQFSEYLAKFDPSYSCAKLEGDHLRVKAKLADFNGDVEARNKKIKDTVSMLHHLAEDTGKTALSLLEMSKIVDDIVGAEHFGDGHSSHATQNN